MIGFSSFISRVATRWYPSLIDVMAMTITQSASGHETRSHDELLLTAIRAWISPLVSPEQVGSEITLTTGDYMVHLDGYYPSVTDEMQLLDGEGRRYEIIDVLHHGTRAQTKLRAHEIGAGS